VTGFRDPDAASRTRERLEALTGLDLDRFFTQSFADVADPDAALTNLERWLKTTGSPGLQMEQIQGLPTLGRRLVTILGASQPIADCLIQNPELASLVLEPGQLGKVPSREVVEAEGRRLLANATSYLHSLDRLRFLRQRWNLAIVLNDLAGTWTQEAVWRGLSDVADAIVALARDVVWAEQRKQRELPEACPVLVVAFGKLGGHELNYSSDIDLAYVLPDGTDERLERDCTRFCEAFGRALTDRMGRGFLYRVDLRLRPYGGAGPIVRSARSVEAYYQLYAEPWEVQALLRSRAISGPEDLVARWEEMRVRTCFRPKLSEVALEEMVAMRARIEDGASDEDLKRGPGGIRDVEFLTQLLQLLHGHEKPALQTRPTLRALRALEEGGVLDPTSAEALREGYAFLRRLEHRTQLVHDQQTHTLPANPAAREALGKLMDLAGWTELARDLDRHRRTIQTLYRSTLRLEHATHADRETVREALGTLGPAALQWFDVLPESAAFYQALAVNQDSLARVRRVLEVAPALVPILKQSVPLTELLLSGEIEEISGDPAERLERLAADAPLKTVASTYLNGYATYCLQWVLSPTFDLGAPLSAQVDGLLRHCARRLYATFDIVGVGSFGTREFGPGSDADLVFLVSSRERQPEAEQQAQHLLAMLGQLKRLGLPLGVDLRLRPEGGKGLLVRTYDGFRAYDLDGMEMWERFALGHARLVQGDPAALEIVKKSAYGLPLTPERLKELARMKRRVETERVQPQHVHRNVKLGMGGLNDLEWLVHLLEMRYPESTKAGTTTDTAERLQLVARAGLLNALEADVLLAARRFLLELRAWLVLQGHAGDLMPENPDRLDRLAQVFEMENGNALLARYQDVTDTVRRLYTESMERLRA
jgi:glutamate-ammonia-ligase adenylyltransferase